MKKYIFKTKAASLVTFPTGLEMWQMGSVHLSVEERFRSDNGFLGLESNIMEMISPSDITLSINDERLREFPFSIIHAETLIEASCIEEAHELGKEKVNQYFDILSLLCKLPIKIVSNDSITDIETCERIRQIDTSINNIGVVNDELKERIYNYTKYMTWIEEPVRNRLLKSVRYYRKALNEKEYDIVFLFLWISLECLGELKIKKLYPQCRTCKQIVEKCIHCGADTAYENPGETTALRQMLVKEYKLISNKEFSDIYSTRSALVHSGKSIGLKQEHKIQNSSETIKKLIPSVIEKILESNRREVQIDDEHVLFHWGFSKV